MKEYREISTVQEILLKNKELIPHHRSMSTKYEAFVLDYMTDYDHVRAYIAILARDPNMEYKVAYKCAAKVLKMPLIQAIINRQTCKFIEGKEDEKREIVTSLKRVYLEAIADKDYIAATGALDKLMKHYNLYEKHQKSKRYSADELVGIRRKLEEQGVSFDIPNKPASIIEGSVSEVIQDEPTEEST